MWIHVPATYSVSVVDTAESSLDSTQPWLAELAQSATWKTKSVSLQSLRRVWKTVPSIQRLSGLTCEPSTQESGVARWISSLGDSRASHIPQRASNCEAQTQGNSVERSSELQPDLDTQLSFLRTSPESSDSTGTPYDPNYERWVTRLRRVSSQRQKQAHLTGENGSSSWPTPHATTHGEGDTSWKERRQRIKEQGINGNGFGLTLGMAATNWPTPTGTERSGINPNTGKGEGLNMTAKNWPTPDAYNDPRAGGSAPWQESYEPGKQIHLHHAARMNWPTPTTADTFTNNLESSQVREGSMHSVTLPRAAGNWPTQDSRSIPQAPTTTQDGHTCSPSCRRLNPRFVEMLMGLPLGWVISSEHLGMALYQQWRRRLIENSAR